MGTRQGCGTLGMLRMDGCVPPGVAAPSSSAAHRKTSLSAPLSPRAEHRAPPLLPLVSAQLSSAHCRDGAAAQRSPCAPGSRSQSQPHGPINVNGNGNRRRLLPAPCQHSRSSHTPPRSAVPPPAHGCTGGPSWAPLCWLSRFPAPAKPAGRAGEGRTGSSRVLPKCTAPLWGEGDVGGGTQPSSSHTALCGVPAVMAAPSHD